MKRSLLFGALCLTLVLKAGATYPAGETPPDFTCDDTDGVEWNLYEQRGQVVFINFGATW